MSRSYYAAYSFLAGALVLKVSVSFRDDREGPEHEPLSDLVAEHLKKTFGYETLRSVRIGIRTLYAARLLADYRPRAAVRETTATEALQTATAIAKNVKRTQI